MRVSVARWLVAAGVVALVVVGLGVVPDVATAGTNSTVEEWHAEYPGALTGGAISETGYLLVGRDGLVIATNRSGAVQYRTHVGGNRTVRFQDATALPAGGYVAVGVDEETNRQFAVRLAGNGTVVWQERYARGTFEAVERTRNGTLIAVGGGPASIAVLDPETGAREVTADLQGTVSDVEQTATGLTVVQYDGRDRRPRVVVVDRTGSVLSGHRFGDPGDRLLSIDGRASGGAVMAGVDFTRDGSGRGWGVAAGTGLRTRWTAQPATVTLDAVAGPNGTIIVGSTGTDDVRWMRRNRTLARLPMEGGPRAIERERGRVLVVGYLLDDGAAAVVRRSQPELSVDSRPLATDTGTDRRSFTVETNATGRIESYHWDLDGDGTAETTTTDPSVEHVFERPGNYTVGVAARTAVGVRVRATTTVTAADRTPPTVRLTSPDNGLVAANDVTGLRANGTTDNRNVTEYRWDVGADGEPEGVTERPTFDYEFGAPNRSYTLDLTAVDRAGNENTTRFELRTARNDQPRIERVTRRAVGLDSVPLSVDYRDRVGTTNVTWRFPNGTVKHGDRIEHSFPEPDRNYTVEVTVRDEYGASDSKTVEIAVESYPGHSGTFDAVVGAVTLALVIGALVFVVALLAVRED